MKLLVQKRGELQAKQAELESIFKEARANGDGDLDLSKVKSLGDVSDVAKAEKIRELNDACGRIAEEVEKLATAQKADDDTRRRQALLGRVEDEVKHGDPTVPARREERASRKSFGELFVESKAYVEGGWKAKTEGKIDVELKTLFETAAGWAPESIRTGRVVDFATRPIQVIDTIPSGQTGQAAVVYMEETTFTNAAAELAEGGTFAESALALTQRTESVKKIATWLPITDEQLEDVAQARSYINGRLPFMLRQRLDAQILVGDGTGDNIEGLINRTGVQTQALGGDTVPDAIYKACTKVKVTGRSFPNAVYLHPNDWQGVRLLKTTDGAYIWGNPAEAGPMRIFGLTVVETDAITENTGLVADTMQCMLVERRGIDVRVSDSHSDFFINGKQAVRADVRVALAVWRPAGFCTVTGI